MQAPSLVTDKDGRGSATISEVRAYGDVVLRFISFSEGEGGVSTLSEDGRGGVQEGTGDDSAEGFSGAFLPNFEDVKGDKKADFGLQRADHIVGNVWDMLESVRNEGVLIRT